MKRTVRVLSGVIAALSLSFLLTACDDRYATSTSDTLVCVFDGSEKGGEAFKFSVAPGEKSRKIDDNDHVVKIPTSNRFFMATSDDNLRDPLAPTGYEANASGGVAVVLAGQVRFRFDLGKACDWYSKHGRRNANNDDLGFNCRAPDCDPTQAGWFHFLAENFGLTMQQVSKGVANRYDWAAMYYDYPVNADEAGVVPEGQQPGVPTSMALGEELGLAFTHQLNANLGGEYFCGVDPIDGAEDDDCPPMTFQVKGVAPTGDVGQSLIASRSKVESTKQELESSRLEGQLQQEQAAQVSASEAAKQQILESQLRTAQLQAQIDTAKCAEYAQFGLDCEGKHAPIIVGGGTGE